MPQKPNEPQDRTDVLAQLVKDALELTRDTISHSSELDKDKGDKLDAILGLLNGPEGLVTRVTIIWNWMQDHKQTCKDNKQAITSGQYSVKVQIIAGIFLVLAGLIGGLFGVWAAHLGK